MDVRLGGALQIVTRAGWSRVSAPSPIASAKRRSSQWRVAWSLGSTTQRAMLEGVEEGWTQSIDRLEEHVIRMRAAG